jgi:hypothetical protein
MIYKENLSYSHNNILPLIKNNSKRELDAEINNINSYNYIDQNIQNNNIKNNNQNNNINLTLDMNHLNGNIYNIINEKEADKDKEQVIYEKFNTFGNTRSRNIRNELNIPFTKSNPFIAKVELENVKSKKDCIFLLDQYLQSHNKVCQYELSSDQDKLIFSFEDEKVAFDFAKIIYNEKNKNYLYRYVIVHMKLLPNKNYLNKQKLEKFKKGLSVESINKLYAGSRYLKKEKKMPKIKGNINFGIKPPFYNVHDKHKKYNSFKTIKNRRCLSRNNNSGDVYGYVGYDGLPLKSYDKLRISVLDTHYNPFSNIKYRDENKNRWLSPSNFKLY